MKNDTVAKKHSYSKNKKEKNKAIAKKKNDEYFECVFVANAKKAQLKKITTGIQDDTYIEILNGIDENSKIIVGPYNVVTKKLKAGDAISVKKDKKDKKNRAE